MKKRGLLIAGVLAVASWWAACLSAEPAPPCLVGRTGGGNPPWVASYRQLSGPATGPCVHAGEVIGVQKYQAVPYNDPNPKLGIKVASMALAPVDPNRLVAIGTFPVDRPENNLCTVATLDAAVQNFPGPPARSVSYLWSNVKFYVTPIDQGTLLSANLQITENACVATYEVNALWPEVECETDADCSSEPDLNANPPRVLGSGISASYATVCSDDVIVAGPPSASGRFPTMKGCIPAKPFPSLK